MPRLDLQYPKEAFSTVKRLNSRASYALRTIHGIVNAAPFLHVAFQDPDAPFPAVLPLIGQMGSFARPSADVGDVQELYLHSYVSTRMMRAGAAAAGTASGDAFGDASGTPSGNPLGLPVTVSAALVDGLVLALSPFHHSYNYRSATLFGHATPVTDPAEKQYALALLTDAAAAPGRWAHARQPPLPAELQSTGVLRVRIAHGSAKIRTGLPHDDAGDMQAASSEGVWTGVLPVHATLGTPIPAPHNRAGDALPDYLQAFWTDTNEAAEAQAIAAAAEPTD